MCGICGLYSYGGLSLSSQVLVRSMNETLRHRGPDDEGYYFDQTVGLGMRRLSIIDLKTGHQPIANEEATVWTVYNGEIYNFPSLRAELEARRHVFATRSDTEVIVHLYEELGEEFVHKLNGMFAIALWDRTQQKLILARDRLGVKPLHYYGGSDGLYFASEIKALLQTDCPRDLDLEALSQYFTFEYIPAPRTIFKSVSKLLPGHMLVVEQDRMEDKPYWDVHFRSHELPERSEPEYVAEVAERLRESVRMRLISDVPLGVFLSGGIDSSAVTALMSQTAGNRIRSFSIGFREESFNELPYARAVAEAFNTEHTEFVVESNQVRDLVPVLMRYLDEPLADASIIPTYIISRLARDQVTVALAGDGGDELFAGYDTYKAYKVAQLYKKVPAFLRQRTVPALVKRLPASKKRLSFEFKAKKFLAGFEYPPEIANVVWWGAYTPDRKDRLLSPDLQAALANDPFAPVAFHAAAAPNKDMLDRLAYLDLKLYLQDDLLVKVDRMSMANSLEIRVPFLDYTFVEFAATIPSRLKLKGLTTKYLMKQMLRGLVPPQVLTRKKIGFDIPLGPWIKDELREFVGDVLSPAGLKKHGFFNEAFIRHLLAEHEAGTHNHRQLLWPLVIFQFWYDHYIG